MTANGDTANGVAANGGGTNGGPTNGGSRANGVDAGGADRNEHGALARPGADDRPGRSPHEADDRDPSRRPTDPDLGVLRPDHPGARQAPTGSPAVPVARRHPSPTTRPGAEHGASRREPGVPVARDEGVPPAVRRPVPGAPGPRGPRGPVAALPSPRLDDAFVLLTPARGTPSGAGCGLRRRVPQSHLAPELRHAANGLADTAAPLAADAAASALSRYQASRLAAQSVVDHPGGRRPDDEGERA